MSSNIKPLIALGLTAAGTALVANFQVSEPIPLTAAAPAGTTTTTGATATKAPTTSTASSSTSTAPDTSNTSTTSTGRKSATATPTPTNAADPTTSGSSNSGYADGTYTGSAVREPWGTFEVQVTVSDGAITAVDLAAAPNDRHSSSINSYAVPQLTEE